MSVVASNIKALVTEHGFAVETIDDRQCLVGRQGDLMQDGLMVEVDGTAILQALNAVGADHLSAEQIQEQIFYLGGL